MKIEDMLFAGCMDPTKRFNDAYTPIPEAGCWLWDGYVSTTGYGRMSVGGKKTGAHRVSYMLHYGEIPDGMQVCHKCDTPACVNPKHLFLGTAKDNAVDMAKKGRVSARPGERNPISKLNDRVVLALRENAISVDDAAEITGASKNVIRSAKKGDSWRHL